MYASFGSVKLKDFSSTQRKSNLLPFLIKAMGILPPRDNQFYHLSSKLTSCMRTISNNEVNKSKLSWWGLIPKAISFSQMFIPTKLWRQSLWTQFGSLDGQTLPDQITNASKSATSAYFQFPRGTINGHRPNASGRNWIDLRPIRATKYVM